MRIFRMCYAVLAGLALPIFALCRAFEYVWPEFRPDARTSLELDRLSRDVTDQTVRRSKFVAFIRRALGHDLFTAGHFDPGRAAA